MQQTYLDARYLRVVPATTFYVGGTGASDANDGQSATVAGGHGPWATLAHGVAVISAFQSSVAVTINIAAGTYTIGAGLYAANILASNIAQWNIVGAGATSTIFDCTATGARGIVSSHSTVTVSGVKISSYYESFAGSASGTMTVNNCNMGGSSHGSGVASYEGSFVQMEGAMTVTGTYLQSVFVETDGTIWMGYSDVNGTTAFSLTFTSVTCATTVQSGNGG